VVNEFTSHNFIVLAMAILVPKNITVVEMWQTYDKTILTVFLRHGV